MKDDEFIEDLQRQLIDGLNIEKPQEKHEFTTLWFSRNVSNKSYNATRINLEKMVSAGKLKVRRRVVLTWGKTAGRGNMADVYSQIEKAKKK